MKKKKPWRVTVFRNSTTPQTADFSSEAKAFAHVRSEVDAGVGFKRIDVLQWNVDRWTLFENISWEEGW